MNIFWFTVSGFIIGGWIAYKIALWFSYLWA